MPALQGKLLLASRRLADPNFFRTVVLMVQHNDEGALGLVLNRPLDISVKQACEDSLEFGCEVEDILHQGGPCQGPLMAVHTFGAAGKSKEEEPEPVIDGLYFATDRDELEWLLTQAAKTGGKPSAGNSIKYFVGYSGWGPGQLEKELESGSWMVTPATIKSVFESDETDQWAKLVTQVTLGEHIHPDMIPDDPSLN